MSVPPLVDSVCHRGDEGFQSQTSGFKSWAILLTFQQQVNSLSLRLGSIQRDSFALTIITGPVGEILALLGLTALQVLEEHISIYWACSLAHTFSPSSELQLLHSPACLLSQFKAIYRLHKCFPHHCFIRIHFYTQPGHFIPPESSFLTQTLLGSTGELTQPPREGPLATVTQLSRCSQFFQSCLQLASRFKQRDVFNQVSCWVQAGSPLLYKPRKEKSKCKAGVSVCFNTTSKAHFPSSQPKRCLKFSLFPLRNKSLIISPVRIWECHHRSCKWKLPENTHPC